MERRRGKGERKVTVFIRPARDADLPQIICVWQRNIRTANTAEDIAELFSQFKNFFFVASLHASTQDAERAEKAEGAAGGKAEIVGFVAGSVKEDCGEPQGHISGIAVEPAFRRRGIATALLKRCEEAFRREGFKRISLEVRPSNSAARSLYEKFGFKPAFVVRRYYADGEDALVYEKAI